MEQASDMIIAKAHVAFELRKYELVIQILSNASADERQEEGYFYLMTGSLFELDKIEGCLEVSEQYLAAFPEDSNAYYLRGCIYSFYHIDNSQALEIFKQAIYYNPYHLHAIGKKVLCQYDLSPETIDIKALLTELDMALEIDPENHTCLLTKISILKQGGHLKLVKPVIDQALKTYPSDYFFHMEAGDYYRITDDYDQAEKHYDLALSIEPDKAKYVFNARDLVNTNRIQSRTGGGSVSLVFFLISFGGMICYHFREEFGINFDLSMFLKIGIVLMVVVITSWLIDNMERYIYIIKSKFK